MKTLKKYLIISTGYPPETKGGICTYAYHMSEFLKKKKIETTILYLSNKKEVIKKDKYIKLIKIKRINLKFRKLENFLNFLKLNFSVINILSKDNYDIIEDSDCLSYCFLIGLLKKELPKKFFLKLHTSNELVFNFEKKKNTSTILFSLIERINYKKFQNIIAPTKFIGNIYSKLYKIDKEKIIYFPYTYQDSSSITPTNNFGEYVLYFGRLQKRKSSDLLLQMIKNNFINKTNVKFKIIGEDTVNFQNEVKIINNETSDCVEFIDYITDKKLLRNYIINASLVLLPSEFESFGLTQIESLYLNPRTFILNNSGPLENFSHINSFNNILSKEEFRTMKYLDFCKIKIEDHKILQKNINYYFGYDSENIHRLFKNNLKAAELDLP